MVVDFQGFHKLPGNFAEFMKKHKRSQVSKCFSMENAGGGGPWTQFWWVSCFHSDHIHPSAVVLFVTFQKLMQDPPQVSSDG